MTTVTTSPGLAVLDAEITKAAELHEELGQQVEHHRVRLARAEQSLAEAEQRLAELRNARALLSGTPTPVTVQDVLTAQDGALGIRIGGLTLGVRADAQDEDLAAYLALMQALCDAAYQQAVRTAGMRRPGLPATQSSSPVAALVAAAKDRHLVAVCRWCQTRITRVTSGAGGPWLHVETRQAACSPGEATSEHAAPGGPPPMWPPATGPRDDEEGK